MLRLWFTSLQPSRIEKLIKGQKGKESLKEAMKNVLIASLTMFLAIVIFSALGIGIIRLMWTSISPYFGDLFNNPEAESTAGFQFQLVVGILSVSYSVMALIMFPIAFFIMQAVQFLLAKAFGGKADFAKQAYYCSLVFAAVEIASTVIVVPCAGIFGLAIVGLLGVYANFQFVKKLHSLGTFSSIAVILASILIGAWLYILFWEAVTSILMALIDLAVRIYGG